MNLLRKERKGPSKNRGVNAVAIRIWLNKGHTHEVMRALNLVEQENDGSPLMLERRIGLDFEITFGYSGGIECWKYE